MKRSTRAAAVLTLVVGIIADEAGAKEVVYAAVSNGRLEKFELSGTHLGGFPIATPPTSIDAYRDGSVYVVPFGLGSAYRYTADGTLLNLMTPTALPGDAGPVLTFGAAVDTAGRFYLGANTNIDRVERFLPDGTSLGIFAFSSAVTDLAFDNNGTLFVNSGLDITRFDSTGAPLGTFASPPGLSTDIAIDILNNTYVVTDSSMIRVYGPAGNLLTSFATGINATSVAFDKNDILYVGGSENASPARAVIHRFLPNGDPLGLFYQSELPPPQRLIEVVDLVVVNVIPEPASIFLAIATLLGLFTWGPRRTSRLPSGTHPPESP